MRIKTANKLFEQKQREIDAVVKLRNKLEKLQAEAHKYDDYYRLPRKVYFADAKRQVRIGSQCTAIEASLQILGGKPWHELDIYNIVLMSVPTANERKEEMMNGASYGGRCEKYKALLFALETALPICKKQVFEAIQVQIR